MLNSEKPTSPLPTAGALFYSPTQPRSLRLSFRIGSDCFQAISPICQHHFSFQPCFLQPSQLPPPPSKHGTPGPRRSTTQAWGWGQARGIPIPQPASEPSTVSPPLPAHLHGGSAAASPPRRLSPSVHACRARPQVGGSGAERRDARHAAKSQRGLFPAGAFLAALSGPKEKQPLSLAATPLPGPPTPVLAACVWPHLGSRHLHQLSASLPAPSMVHSPWSCSLPCPAERCPQPRDGACVLGAANLDTA